MGQEALSNEHLYEFSRQGFIVFASVAYVGENLCQRLLVVDADEVLVLRQVLLIIIIGVDIHSHIVVVALLVNETLQWQAVGEGRLFGWPTHSKRGDGHHELWQVQCIDNLLRLVNGGA